MIGKTIVIKESWLYVRKHDKHHKTLPAKIAVLVLGWDYVNYPSTIFEAWYSVDFLYDGQIFHTLLRDDSFTPLGLAVLNRKLLFFLYSLQLPLRALALFLYFRFLKKVDK